MNQLLLSSRRLESNKVLQSGYIDVFEMLQKHENSDCLNLSAELPEMSLTLHWKEVTTPATPESFKALSGKKLQEYKFQYLGQFKYNNLLISSESESFSSSFPDRNIHNCEIENTGWVNCTWLIDFLMNAKSIQENPLRSERLFWQKEKDNFVLSLSSEALDLRNAEQEKFLFNKEFTRISWSHTTLFAGH